MKTAACPIKILLVDDDRRFAEAARHKLDSNGLRTALDSVTSLKGAISKLNKKRFDVVILNPFFGPIQGPAAYLSVRRLAPNAPVLLMVGAHYEGAAMNMLELGADDYIIKETTRPSLLWHTARSTIQHCLLKQHLRHLETVSTQSDNALLIGEIKDDAPLQSEVVFKSLGFDRLNGQKQKSFKDLAGYLEATIGKSSLEAKEIVQAITSRKSITKRVQTKRADGSKLWTELKFITLENVEEALKHFVLIRKDISQEQSIQSILEHVSLLEKQQSFLSNLAHDFKAPLLGAIFATEMIKEERLGPLTVEQITAIDQLQSNNKQLLRLATNMLEMYEKQEMNVRPSPNSVKLKELAEQCALAASPMARANGLKVVSDVKLKFEQYYADENAFKLIVSNLLDNAIAFSPRGGYVTLIVKSIGKEIVIRVIDQGPTLTKEQQSSVFTSLKPEHGNPRYTAATALALFVSNKIVEAYGGTIRCFNLSNAGMTWEVALPLVHESNL